MKHLRHFSCRKSATFLFPIYLGMTQDEDSTKHIFRSCHISASTGLVMKGEGTHTRLTLSNAQVHAAESAANVVVEGTQVVGTEQITHEHTKLHTHRTGG